MKILRVSTFPTIEKRTVGMHASELCNIDSAKTIFLTSREKLSRPNIKGDFKLFEFGKPLEKRANQQYVFTEFFFIIRRVFQLLIFSFYGVWLLFFKKIDIVHIHSPMYIIIATVGFLVNKKVYITFHGTDFHKIKNSWWYKFFAKIFRKVFVISPDMIPHLSEIHGKKNIILAHNGINQNIYKNQNLIRKKQIIAVGEFKEEKGFEYLIEAFSNLKKNDNFKDYTLLIIGDGRLRKEFEKQIQSLNMTNFIHLPGSKNREELINLYNQSEVFVLSSISEGFPKVLLEAISCGCKIVSTDCGSASSVLKDIKLARPKITEDLTTGLSDCIESKSKSNIDIDEFTWESVLKVYYDEYKDINL